MTQLALRPAHELCSLLAAGEVSSRELVALHLERIEQLNPSLNAVVTLDADRALDRAAACDRDLAARRTRGPLHGLPMTIKDCFETAGIRTTSGSPDRAEHVPDGDAIAVARLVAAGAIVIGKTNLPEEVTGQETGNALFGRTCNPWDVSRTPGGSSGGAAAAVASGMTPLELGSDSGGSIRQPCHYCGVYGHFPSRGLVPLAGHMPLLPRHDRGVQVDLMGVGPIARSASDLALALGVLAGPDEPASRAYQLGLPPPRHERLRDYRIGVWLDDAHCPTDVEVLGPLEAAAAALADAGVTVERAVRPEGFPLAALHRAAFALWVSSTAISTERATHERLVAIAQGLSPDDYGLPAQRARAQAMGHRDWQLLDAARRDMARAWDTVFDDVDVLLCPVSPILAPAHDPEPDQVDDLDRRVARTIEVNGDSRPYLDQMTWNIVVGAAGLPSTVAPVGLGPRGLPVGVQVVGRHLDDRTTLDVARRMADVIGGYEPPPLAT